MCEVELVITNIANRSWTSSGATHLRFLLEAITENENTDLEACVLFFLQGLRNCLPGQAEEDTVGSLSLCTNKSKEYNLNV